MAIAGAHFISGLPRSGSTLLGAILGQNPRFHAGMSSPVGSLMGAVQGALGPNAEFADQISDRQRRDVLAASFASYYASVADGRIVFDTNRRWCARLPMVATLFPEAKVIACVRDLALVLDSVERMVQSNGLARSRMFGPRQDLDVFARCEALMDRGGMVGGPWHAFQEAFFGPHSARMLVLDYEALATDPAAAMARVYAFVGEEPFAHDFESVSYDGGEGFDAKLGVPGLHAVRPKVEFRRRGTVLPPEIHNKWAGRCFWRGEPARDMNVAVVAPPPAAKGAPARQRS